MGQYNKKGMYAGYDKNHKEREKKDYYSTPTEEVFNILDKMDFKFVDTDVILEPSCGGGHMLGFIGIKVIIIKLLLRDGLEE